MADISKIKLPSGETYDLKVYSDKVEPMLSKTFTGVIGTANDWANAVFFYGKILPVSYHAVWRIHYRIYAEAAGRDDSKAIADVTITGTQSTMSSYASFNTIAVTTYRPAYYNELYRATSAGITNGYGHALGIRLYSSWNPATAANARTISIDILSVENCSFTFFDSMTKYASIPGTGSTNYSGYSEMNFIDNGMQESGDANTYDRTYISSATWLAGANGINQYSLFMEDASGAYQSLTLDSGTGTTKRKNPTGFRPGKIWYTSSGSNIAAGSSAGASTAYYTIPFDFRYSSNCGTALTNHKPLYLVFSEGADGFLYLADIWWTQVLPSSEDGYLYMYVGVVYGNGYSVHLSPTHPVYKYADGIIEEWVPYAENVDFVKRRNGKIAVLKDGADNYPVNNLTVGIEPVQDLHGYDAPWPAGGGKNKANYPYMIECGCVEQSDGSLYLQRATTLSEKIVYSHNGAGQITITFIVKNNENASSRGANPRILYTDGTGSDVQTSVSAGLFKTFIQTSNPNKTVDKVTFTYGGSAIETWFYIQIEEGATATAWTPYSNICPITGWTGAKVRATGKNLFDMTQLLQASGWQVNSDGVYYGQRLALHTAFMNGFPILPTFKPGVQYTLTVTGHQSEELSFTDFRIIHTDGSIAVLRITSTTPTTQSITSTSGKTVKTVMATYGSGGAILTYLSQIQLEESATATAYEPFGTTHTIDFPDEAGTVYGGTLDVTSGMLTVDRAIAIISSGVTTVGSYASGVWAYTMYNVLNKLSPSASRRGATLSNMFMPGGTSDSISAWYCYATGGSVVFTTDYEMTVEQANAWLANNQLQVCYTLAEPVTYQLSPVEIMMLLGINTIWADTGEILNLEYVSSSGWRYAQAIRNVINTDTTYEFIQDPDNGHILTLASSTGDSTTVTIPDNNTTYTGTSPITVSGTTISHANSGVTAASKGDTTNQTPTWGGTFKVPSGTVNAAGHLTAFADHTVTIPNTLASANGPGLMSAADKNALANLEVRISDVESVLRDIDLSDTEAAILALALRVQQLESHAILDNGYPE